MALSIGQLTAEIDADPSGMIRGLSEAELAAAGFRRGAEGELRRTDGSLVSTGTAARELGRAFAEGADRASLATAGLRRNAAGDITNVLGGTRGLDEAFERMGHQMLLASDNGSRGLRTLGREADHSLGDADDRSRSLASRFGSLASAAVGAAGSLGGFLRLPAMIGAGIPAIAGLIGTLESIVPAAAAGASAIVALAGAVAAVKIGTSGIGGALKAAFAPPSGGGGGGGGAAKAVNQVADAQRNLARATSNAAYANKQAAQQVASAERDLVSAQRAALAAQKAINDARTQATRDLQDMNNSLVDAQNSERDAQFAVTDAADALAQAKTTGNPDEIARAQLAYDEAVQALKEQQLQVQRLTVDTAAANKAGVEGSKTVTDAKANEAQAVQDVRDKTLALSNAQEAQARTAQQGADAILQAKEALVQAGAAGGGAAGGVDAFAQAMANLAPNARAFVREIVALKPAWDALRLDVQQRLFAGLATSLAAAAAVDLPILRRSLDTTAGSLNTMALGVLGAARNLGRSGVLGQALDGAAAGLHSLTRIPGQVVTAFGQIAAAGAPLFQRITAAAGSAADSISARLSAAFSSGGLSQAIDTAVGVLKQLGTVIGNVGSIIGSVFSAAGSAGGSWLGILAQITGAMAKAFQQPGVQAALGALFSTMRVLGETLGPLVAQALGALAPVLVTLGPPAQLLVKSLGAALQPIIKALGPILLAAAQAVGALVTALSPLLPIVGALIAALLPVLLPVLDLLTSVFSDLAGPIKQIAVALGTALRPVIKGLTTVMQDLVDQYLNMFLDLLGQITPLIPVLVPVLIQLGQSFGQILTAVAPLLPQLASMTFLFITQMLPAILPLIPPLAQLTTVLLILATDVIVGVVVPTLAGLVKALGGLQAAFGTVVGWVAWLVKEIVRLFTWLYDVLVGHSIIPDLVRSIAGWFARLPGMAIAALGNIAARLAGVMVNATNRMINATSTGLAAIVSWMRDLPGRAKSALGDIGSYLYRSGQALLDGFARGIKSMAGIVKSAAGSVLSGARNLFPFSPAKEGPFSGRGWTEYSGQALGEGLAQGMRARQDHVARAAAALMGSAADQFGGVGVPGVGVGGGFAGGAAGGSVPAGGGQQTVRIVVDGPDAVKKLIRAIVLQDGRGSVQTAFGRG